MKEETKRKLSERMKGDNNPSKRPEVRKKISGAMKGKSPWNKGRKSPETSGDNNVSKRPEVREKISKALIGKHPSIETRKKLSESHKGKKHSKEHKEKISNGIRSSDKYKEAIKNSERNIKISEANKNRIVSKETRKKIGDGNRGKIISQDVKERISKTLTGKYIGEKHPNYGKHLSEKQKKILSEANKGKLPSSKSCYGKGNYYNSPLQGKIWLRSSYELAYAKYLDDNKTLWYYEIQTFDLGNTTYTPDFFLPRYDKFIEVKGYMHKSAQYKINKFLEQYPFDLDILYKDDLIKLGVKL